MKKTNLLNKLGFLIILANLNLSLYSVNLNIVKNVSDDNGTKTEIISNIKDSAGKIITDKLQNSKITINKILNYDNNQKLEFIIKNALKISAVATFVTGIILLIKKFFYNKRNDLETIDKIINFAEQDAQNLIPLNQEIQNKKFQLFEERKKWALWPSEMTFLKILEIPQEILVERLFEEIRATYKNNTISDPDKANTFAIESFLKDIDSEISDYKRKYNIILIGNVERKEECLIKVKDNIKKLIYFKNTVTSWSNKK